MENTTGQKNAFFKTLNILINVFSYVTCVVLVSDGFAYLEIEDLVFAIISFSLAALYFILTTIKMNMGFFKLNAAGKLKLKKIKLAKIGVNILIVIYSCITLAVYGSEIAAVFKSLNIIWLVAQLIVAVLSLITSLFVNKIKKKKK